METVKKKSWFRQLFPETKEEYIGIINYSRRFIWSEEESEFEAALYKKVEVESGKILSVYTTIPQRGKVYFDVNAFEKEGKLIKTL